jgi:hypothetical protein
VCDTTLTSLDYDWWAHHDSWDNFFSRAVFASLEYNWWAHHDNRDDFVVFTLSQLIVHWNSMYTTLEDRVCSRLTRYSPGCKPCYHQLIPCTRKISTRLHCKWIKDEQHNAVNCQDKPRITWQECVVKFLQPCSAFHVQWINLLKSWKSGTK